MAASNSHIDAMREGAADVSPILLGVAPFGLVWGAAVVDQGLDLVHAIGFSTIVFAGASQLAALDLLGRDAPLAVAILTALVINARMLMYGASLAPHLGVLSVPQRSVGAYLLTDQAYAVSISRFTREPGFEQRFAYYSGAGVALWLTWQLTTVLGVLVGDAVPDSVPLDFAVPVTFLALLVPAVTDRPTLAAALTAGGVATAAADLPANLGMITGALAGIGVGFLLSYRRSA